MTGSVIIEAADGSHRNRLLWVRPDGEVLHYDKRHLFRMAGEHKHYTPGMQQALFELNGWRVRPLICYDLRFPVWSRDPHGTDLLLYTANWPAARRDAGTACCRRVPSRTCALSLPSTASARMAKAIHIAATRRCWISRAIRCWAQATATACSVVAARARSGSLPRTAFRPTTIATPSSFSSEAEAICLFIQADAADQIGLLVATPFVVVHRPFGAAAFGEPGHFDFVAVVVDAIEQPGQSLRSLLHRRKWRDCATRRRHSQA